jgi:hypothetical protein
LQCALSPDVYADALDSLSCRIGLQPASQVRQAQVGNCGETLYE